MTFDPARQIQDALVFGEYGDVNPSLGDSATYTFLRADQMDERFGITTRFVDLLDAAAVRAAITPTTRVVYCESISNPLLEVADLPAFSRMAHEHGL
jgi:cystathionine beta-lyase/cystathionine gamma-synthase